MTQFKAVDQDGRYDNILAQMVLNEAYDIEYGLYDHDNPDLSHPLQGVLSVETEHTLSQGPVKTLFEIYYKAGIQKYFGISLLEFIELPAIRADQLLKIANDFTRQENELVEESTRKMEKLSNDMKNSVNAVNQVKERFG